MPRENWGLITNLITDNFAETLSRVTLKVNQVAGSFWGEGRRRAYL